MIKYIYGPVKSGKTQMAIDEVKKQGENFAYIIAKEDIDILKIVSVNFKNIIITNAQFIDDRRLMLLKTWAKDNFINIYFIGLVSDRKNREYPSHKSLLYLADVSVETEAICDCGAKATCNICVNKDGEAVLYNNDVDIKATYKAVCKECHDRLTDEAKLKQDRLLITESFIECYN